MFSLPLSTKINSVVPKNTFDTYTSSSQKKQITEKILRLTLLNKLAEDSTNLEIKNIEVIQIIEVELKVLGKINDLLSIIDKILPHHIIFIVRFENQMYISTSAKHLNPKDESRAVIDYTFTSDWMNEEENVYNIELKQNLDWVFKNFCDQLKPIETDTKSISELVQKHKHNDAILKEIDKLKSEIAKCKQFNKKVELNMRLKKLLRF